MRTLISDPLPTEVDALLDRRRRLGLDRKDEVWEGVLHVVPAPSHRHSALGAQVISILRDRARDAALEVTLDFNLGTAEDFRVPDGGLHRPGAAEMWHPTAALVVEILSLNDETREKLSFYASHDVEEILIVDPDRQRVEWLALGEGGYQSIEQSRLIGLAAIELADLIQWPDGAA